MIVSPDSYTTISSDIAEGFYSEKRSKFYAYAHHVTTEREVQAVLQTYRRTHYDARHICYAYVLDAAKQCFRANDDGEPAGTAGKPILGQIVKHGLAEILVVVVRYYGGVNLGTGGLVVAYRAAAAAAIGAATTVEKIVHERVAFSFPYALTNAVMRLARESAAQIVDNDYADSRQTVVMSVRRSMAEVLRSKLEQLRLTHLSLFDADGGAHDG